MFSKKRWSSFYQLLDIICPYVLRQKLPVKPQRVPFSIVPRGETPPGVWPHFLVLENDEPHPLKELLKYQRYKDTVVTCNPLCCLACFGPLIHHGRPLMRTQQVLVVVE